MKTMKEQGYELLDQLHGAHSGQNLMNAVGKICPDFVDMTAEFGFGRILSRPGLDLSFKELIIIALCVAQGDMNNQLKAHIEAALNCGATKEQVIEAILLVVPYAGFARVTNAFLASNEILASDKGC